MKDLNNFHAFFPEGCKRRALDNQEYVTEREQRIMGDLDVLLSGFDPQELMQERELWVQKMHKVRQMVKKNPLILPEEVEPLELEYGDHFQRVQEIVHPFYKKMIQLGYSRDDLII